MEFQLHIRNADKYRVILLSNSHFAFIMLINVMSMANFMLSCVGGTKVVLYPQAVTNKNISTRTATLISAANYPALNEEII